jgi:phosphoribosylglycinamide formyltransferase-1
MSRNALNIAVFGSGRGSNFQAILRAMETGKLSGTRIVLVVSNNPGAGILEIARNHGIPALPLGEKQFPGEEQFVSNLLHMLSKHDVNFIVLAGYMKRLHPRLIQAYRNAIVNIHPALLPKFGGKGLYGMHVHEAVIAAGEKISGATVHIVDEEYDHGPIVLQQAVPVHSSDTPESLAARVLEIEHEIYPEAIRLFAEGRVTVRESEVEVQY